MRRALALVGAGTAILLVVAATNTLRFGSRQLAVEPLAPRPLAAGLVERLAGAIRFRTVSYQDPRQFESAQFEGFHRFLGESFPRLHARLMRETVGGFSLLFTWRGSDEAAAPVLLLAHQDVVPVDPTTEASWVQPPFAGTIADGFVWGRGALDDKLGVMGLLEAVEMLVGDGFSPRCTFYLAFGHDEEVGGRTGAGAMARLLAERGVAPAFVLDEGLTVTEGIVPGVSRPLALVGVAEKGYLSLELIVQAEGGHSSRPPRHTAIGILANALARLEAHPAPPALAGAARALLDFAGPEMALPHRAVIANLWLSGPFVLRRLAASPETDALIRTTTAPTMLEGSVKENVLPTRARAVVNFRIRPGESVASTTEHVRRTIDDPRVTLTPLTATLSEPSPEAPMGGPAFAALVRTIREVFPAAAVAPSLVLGATDSRHYAGLSRAVYRFLPTRMRPEDGRRVHGIDERVAVADYENAVRFYAQLIRNADAAARAAGG